MIQSEEQSSGAMEDLTGMKLQTWKQCQMLNDCVEACCCFNTLGWDNSGLRE